MAAPTKLVSQNTPDALGGSHQRNSSWVVAIVSFEQAAAMYSEEKDGAPKTKKVLVIENDCLSVSISNSKSSFGKIASLQLKSTDLWYPGYIASGDWMFVWMVDNQDKADEIAKNLKAIPKSPGKALCDELSGLKFAGRVLKIHTNDVVTNNSRTVTQTVTGQSFLEFATSVYYTYAAQAAASTLNLSQLGGYPLPAALDPFAAEAFLKFGQDDVLGKIADKFLEQYKFKNNHSPDTIIGLYYTFIMGVNSAKAIITDPEFINTPATGHHIIKVPKSVAQILGKGSAEFLWELIDLNLGLQKYTTPGLKWYEKFQPDFDPTFGAGNIRRTNTPTEGFVPFRPAIWDNQSMWSILQQYLNPVVNEMYTSMRINGEGRIVPTFTVREKPFSTGLFNYLKSDGTVTTNMIASQGNIPGGASFGSDTLDLLTGGSVAAGNLGIGVTQQLEKEKSDTTVEAIKEQLKSENRTLFGQLPRWVIDRTMIKAYGYYTDEANRINYVQIWGTNSAPEFLGIQMSGEKFKQSQFDLGNAYHDASDITRNGLRSLIMVSNFDIYLGDQSASFANLWAKKNADWAFNGHLKAFASVTLNGVIDPICEGDNCEINDESGKNGVVYHIESVTHVGTITRDGKKTFETVLSLSNGMLKQSFIGKNADKPPTYIIHLGPVRESKEGPGYTETQILTSDTGSALDKLKGIL